MEEGNKNPSPTNNTNMNTTTTNHQTPMSQQLFQQQLFLLHQYQQHQQHHPPPQNQPQSQQQNNNNSSVVMNLHHHQQQQQAMSRFPSNIDAHLRAPGLRSLHLHQQQQQNPPIAAAAAAAAGNSAAAPSLVAAHQQQAKAQQQQQMQQHLQGNPVEVEMAHQDLIKVCNPDVKRPFVSLENAIFRLLPYHVVADFEAEEDDRVLDNDTTGQTPSRLQQWDHNILAKIAEFTTTFEKQILAFNIMSRKRALGEFRSEERLMLEQALFNEEKHAILEMKQEMESREKAAREAAEAKMRMAMAQAEQARAPMRASAIGSRGDEGSGGHDLGPEQGGDNNMEEMIHGWGPHNNNNNGQRDEEEPSEDFLNDNNGEEGAGMQEEEEWQEAGELDLNTRRCGRATS